MIPTIKQKIAECEKEIQRLIDLQDDGILLDFDKVGVGYKRDLVEKELTTWKEALKLAEENMKSLVENIDEIIEFYDSFTMINKKGIMINSIEVLESLKILEKKVFGGADKT